MDLKAATATKIRLFRVTVESVLLYGNVDRDVEAGEKCQWMLHQNVANGPKCVLGTTYEQQRAVREPPKN